MADPMMGTPPEPGWHEAVWQEPVGPALAAPGETFGRGGEAAGMVEPEEGLPVSVRFSSSGVRPNETVTMTLSLEEAGDLHDFSVILDYNPNGIKFISLQTIGITESGIHFSGYFNDGLVGLAVSRSDNTPISATGDFLQVTFRVKAMAQPGELEFRFLSPEMSDSDGEELDFLLSDPPPLPLLEGIGLLEMATPPLTTITEGEAWQAAGRLFAGGLSGDPERAGDVESWIGIHEEATHPETWPEEAWIPVQPGPVPEEEGPEAEEWFWYRGDVTWRRSPGTWHLAIRSRLEGESWHYGGLETFPSGGMAPLPVLEIEPQTRYRFSLAEWDFETARLTPVRFTAENDTAKIRAFGRPPLPDPPTVSRSNGIDWLDTQGWQPIGELVAGLSVALSTEGFGELAFSASHTVTSAGPGRFKVQLSSDALAWEDLPGGEIDLTSQTAVHLENLLLDEKWQGLNHLHIRWVRIGDERADGSESAISNSSYFRIGQIRLTGRQADPGRIDVHPGDANGDGIVNAEDVLSLGYHWLRHGPGPAYGYIDFEPREVERWVPAGATHADTNGDGVVDHRDLKAIGLHFGKVVAESGSEEIAMERELHTGVDQAAPSQQGFEPAAGSDEPAATSARIVMPALRAGEEQTVTIETNRRERFRGVALRLVLESSNPDEESPEWELSLDSLAGPAADAAGQQELLTLLHQKGLWAEAAWSLQGRQDIIEDYRLATLSIRARNNWEAGHTLRLEWVSLGREDGIGERLGEPQIRLGDAAPPGMELPEEEELMLYPNFPNPFRTQTTIRYYLPERMHVRLELFDTAGRRVAVLADGEQPEGLHTTVFGGEGLASGVYLFRLSGGRESRYQKMIRIR